MSFLAIPGIIAGAASAWDPSQLVDGISWWDAVESTLTKSGSDVTGVTDLVGSNDLTVPSGDNAPLDVTSDTDLGRRAIQHAEANDEVLQVTISSQAQPVTYWWLGTVDSFASYNAHLIGDQTASVSPSLHVSTAGLWSADPYGDTADVTEPVVDTPYLAIMVLDGECTKIYINNVEQNELTTNGTAAVTDVTFGDDFNGYGSDMTWTSGGVVGAAMVPEERALLWQWAQDEVSPAAVTLIEHSTVANSSNSPSSVSPEWWKVGFEISFSPGTITGTHTLYDLSAVGYTLSLTATLLQLSAGGVDYDITPSSNFTSGNNYTVRVRWGVEMELSGDATGTVSLVGAAVTLPGQMYIGRDASPGIRLFPYGTLEEPVAIDSVGEPTITPADMSPAGWWHAGAKTLNGTDVSALPNQGSASADFSQATPADQPEWSACDPLFNYQPVIDTTVTNAGYFTTGVITGLDVADDGDCTIITVFSVASTEATNGLWGTGASNEGFRIWNAGSGSFSSRANDGTTTLNRSQGTLSIDTVYIGVMEFEGATSPSNDTLRLALDGTEASGTGDLGAIGNLDHALLATDNLGGSALLGKWAETLFFTRLLTAQEKLDLSTYFFVKYTKGTLI